MAAGVTIKSKRKAGAFTAGQLAIGEIGVDTTNGDLYFSVDGSTVTHIDVSAIGGAGQLSDLTDVNTSTPTNRNVLVADGVDWESRALTEADISDLGGTVTMNADTDVSTNSWVLDEDNMASDSATKVPTQQSVKAYVDAAVVGLLQYQGGYNASTNTPDLDVSPSGINQGDAYTVTAAGSFFSVNVGVGDFLIAEQDNPTLAAHWTIVQSELDNVASTAASLAQFAATTSAELAGVISDETGSGPLVFGTSPALGSPVLTTPQINDTSSDHQYIFGVAELTGDRTVSLPLLTGNDTFTFDAHAATLSNKTISDSGSTIDGGSI